MIISSIAESAQTTINYDYLQRWTRKKCQRPNVMEDLLPIASKAEFNRVSTLILF